jgi:hypothetical protein
VEKVSTLDDVKRCLIPLYDVKYFDVVEAVRNAILDKILDIQTELDYVQDAFYKKKAIK